MDMTKGCSSLGVYSFPGDKGLGSAIIREKKWHESFGGGGQKRREIIDAKKSAMD